MRQSKKVRGIYERKPGSREWCIRWTDEHGKLRRQTIGENKDLAKSLLRGKRKLVRIAKLTGQSPVAPLPPALSLSSPTTLAAMIDDVLVRSQRLRSIREYERSAKVWKEVFAGRTLESIIPGDIERWRAAQYDQKEGPKPATLNRHLAFLKRVFLLAQRDGKCLRTPFLDVKLEKENNTRVRFLTDDEEQRLCAVLEEQDRLRVCIAAYTGMRQGEQFPLKWKQVDFENKVITLPQTKGGESQIVYLSDAALGFFKRMFALSCLGPYVFPSSNGATPVEASNFAYRVWIPALERAQIENFRWHDLRHTYGSRLAMAGATENEIMRLMRHKSTAMAQRYIHLSQGHLHDTVAKLDAVAERIHGKQEQQASDDEPLDPSRETPTTESQSESDDDGDPRTVH